MAFRLTSLVITAMLVLVASANPIAGFLVNNRFSSLGFKLSNFYFTGSPHSITQSYNFDVTDGARRAHCGTTSSVTPGLMPFGLTPCNESAWSFSFTYNDKAVPTAGWTLAVTQAIGPHCNITGTRFFDKSAVKLVVNQFNPNGNFYKLDAPSAFDLAARVVYN